MSPILKAIALGCCVGLGFYTPLWILSCISIALIISVQHTSFKQHLAVILLFCACIQGGGYFALFWHTLPLTWVHQTALAWHVLYIALAWLYVTAFGTLPFIFFGTVSFIFSRSSLLLRSLALPSAWVLSEWLSAITLSIGVKGSGSIIEAGSTIAFLGNQLARNIALLQMATLGGVYVLSFCAVLGAVLLEHALHSKKRNLSISIAFMFCIVSLGSLLHIPTLSQGAPKKISLITTYTRPLFEVTGKNRSEDDTRIAALVFSASTSDAVILPEATEFLKRNRSYIMQHTSSRLPVYIIDSESILSSNVRYRRNELFNTRDESSQFSMKEFLVPFGEYIPLPIEILFSVVHSSFIGQISKDRVYEPRHIATQLFIGTVSVGLHLCDEITNPLLSRADVTRGAELLLYASSYSWYHQSHILQTQIMRAAQIRAAENRRFLVNANDSAPSFALDPYGQMLATSSWNAFSIITVTVFPHHEQTPYTIYGEYVLIIPLLLLLLCIYHERRLVLRL